MVRKCIPLFFVLASIARGESCRDLNRRSCWHVVNKSTQNPLSINCTTWGGTPFNFGTSNIKANGGIYSEQYNLSWGDGLGFPEPGINVSCEIRYPNRKATLQFRTMDWGERAKFEANEREVILTRKGWGRDSPVVREPMGPSSTT
jgi:hypothetical protein